MCLKAVKIDEGLCAIALKKALPAMFFEKSLHSGNSSKCKQSQLTHDLEKFTSQIILVNS